MSTKSDGSSGSTMSAKTFLTLLVVLPALVAGGVFLGWDKIPPNIQQGLSTARDTLIEQVSVLSTMPESTQIPLMAAGATLALLVATTILIKVKNNLKQVVTALVLMAMIGGGGAYYFRDSLFQKSHPEIDRKIAALGQLTQPAELAARKKGTEQTESSGDTVCTIQNYEAAAKFDKLLVLDPTTDVIYPGALIKGESIGTGEYTPIVVDRRPITVSASLENIQGSVSATIDDPKLSSVRDAVKNILNQKVTGATAARNTFEIIEVHSSDQLQFAIGANYSYSAGVASVKGGFSFDREEKKSRYLLKFIQSYYTIDLDLPKNPTEIFANPEELDVAMFGSVSPMYVSTVTYGRMALFSVESSATSTALKLALDASFRSGVHEGGVTIDAAHQSTLSESTIKGTIIGGSGADAAGAIWGIEGLKTYINQGGNWSHDSPAAPLSYKLRYLADNSIGNIVLATEYKVRNCTKITQNDNRYRVTLISLDGGADAGDLEVCADLVATAVVYSGTNPARSEAKPIWNSITYGAGGNWKDPTQTHYLPDLDPGTSIPLNKTVEFTVSNPDVTRSSISISGFLIDADSTGENDLIGRDTKKVMLTEIGSSPKVDTLIFSGPDGTATVLFKMELIR